VTFLVKWNGAYYTKNVVMYSKSWSQKPMV